MINVCHRSLFGKCISYRVDARVVAHSSSAAGSPSGESRRLTICGGDKSDSCACFKPETVEQIEFLRATCSFGMGLSESGGKRINHQKDPKSIT